MFNQMARSRGLVTRCILILTICIYALLPAAALADSGGGIEPPITAPEATDASAGDLTFSLALAVIASLSLVP